MEKAMLNAHGVCYEVYRRKHDVRMQVEKRREKEYLISRHIHAVLDRKINR